jgi:hypothetical protein
MKNIYGSGLGKLAQRVLLGRRVLAICLEELEWEIREKYCDKIPTNRNRIKIFVAKHIDKLQKRDAVFQEYYRVLKLQERTR